MGLGYEKLGLRVGFEIHQELNTHKLFCNCPSRLREKEPSLKVKRRLRPTQSEMGKVDRAALAEALKGKGFVYQVYPDSTCLVELDDEPPHPINEEALNIALEAALLLGAKPVDEVHTMRKIVIDGSNTCGFQRTALVALAGGIETDGKSFRIPTICLEEDAARKMDENPEYANYRLDRLGIPLVEITTGPDFSDPETPAKAALHIGQILRATGKVKRGIGTIRQDINISIADGARQEIKGVQELSLISEVIEREVRRQLALLEIRDELRRRGARKVEGKGTDVAEIFSGTKSGVVRKEIGAGGRALAVKLPKFAGILGRELQPGRRFGTELADQARLYGKVGGIFHTDELPRYGISEEETDKLRSTIGAAEDDAVVFVVGYKERAELALKAVVGRVNQALQGVPEETRRALRDGNTEFMRPLPGAERMYPETDIPPIPITRDRLNRIRRKLPELPEQKVKRFIKEYHLSQNLASRISLSENVALFEEIVKKCRVDPTLVASTLEETLVSLRREGVPVENLNKKHLECTFKLLSLRKIMKESIPQILSALARKPREKVEKILDELGLKTMSIRELKDLVSGIVDNNIEMVREQGEKSHKKLMGVVMKEVKGRADGKKVSEILREKIKSRLKG
ncbi:MAG: Glu-tRNA(Gln) amidotransferase subunit GatE [Hadesarchaea archaeon]|nr:MAG: Glu-tRNA(Gln) amidotransferase subunit GatE [Hadesarchaea archaeon]